MVGSGARLVAYLIDLFLLILVCFLLGMVIGVLAPASDPEQVSSVFNLIGTLIFWVYCANLESGHRQRHGGQARDGAQSV